MANASKVQEADGSGPKEATEEEVASDSDSHGLASQVWRRLTSSQDSTPLVIVMLTIVAIFWFLLRDTGFMSMSNMTSIIRATTMVSVMAVATVFVLGAGEIDLSFASIPPLTGYVAALLLREDYPVLLAVVAALLVGAFIGLVNGAITVGLRVPSFIVTLGMIGVLEGAARWLTNREAIPVDNETFTQWLGSGSVGPVPVLIIWTVAVGILGYVVLNWTPYGKAVLATGANAKAARYSGIRTGRVRIGVLVISGLGGALAGVLYSGFLHSARYDLGSGDLLTVLAAVIIGGTALTGGRGRVLGAIAGSLLLGLINNGVILLGFDTAQQRIVRGSIIVLAVMLSGRELYREQE